MMQTSIASAAPSFFYDPLSLTEHRNCQLPPVAFFLISWIELLIMIYNRA